MADGGTGVTVGAIGHLRQVPREIVAWLATSGLLSGAIALDHGHYSPRALALVLAACATAAVAVQASLAPVPPRPVSAPAAAAAPALDVLLALLLVVLLVAGALDRPGVHLEREGLVEAYRLHQWGLAAAVGACIPALWRGRTFPPGLFAAALLSACALRLGIIAASPRPAIDVFWQFQDASAHLLAGLNPYTTPVRDPTDAAARFGYLVRAYAYPPGALVPQALAYAVSGDVRHAAMVADLATAAITWAIARPARGAAAALLALLVLHQPRALFVLEQAWQEPLLAAGLAVTVWLALTHGRFGVMAGITLATKQYFVVFLAPVLVRQRRWDALVPLAVGGVLAWLPFLVWDAPAALRNGLWFQLQTPFRPDGLTLLSALHAVTGAAPGKGLAAVAGLATSAALAWRTRHAPPAGAWLQAGTAALLAAFVLGSQAFANYYHLVALACLLLVAVRLRERGTPAMAVPGGMAHA